MHGCPPGEIERIAGYLLAERGLHTAVKCNPTLLGAERVRGIINGDLGYGDVVVPDAAFGHDLKWEDAAPMFRRLQEVAAGRDRHFGLKLSNTLEVENWRTVFPKDPMMYLSGRPLHALTTNLALLLAEEFQGALPLSFAGGADCCNAPQLLACGLRPVTVCSDLLKSGGYLRLLQYLEETEAAMEAVGAADLDDFACRVAGVEDAAAAGLANLRRYAAGVGRERRYRKDAFETGHSKTTRQLGLFDCIAAPCTDECPVDQDVPQYMAAVREGRFADAVAITRRDNPLASILGHVCDHRCEHTCIRTHYDEPLAIREMKRFIMAQEKGPAVGERAPAARREGGRHRGRAGRPLRRPDAGAGRVRGHRLREARLRRGHGGRRHPGLPPAAGAHRRRPGRPRPPRGDHPLRPGSGEGLHAVEPAVPGVRPHSGGRGGPGGQAPRHPRRGGRGGARRHRFPALGPGGPSPRHRGAGGRGGGGRHRHGLRPHRPAPGRRGHRSSTGAPSTRCPPTAKRCGPCWRKG